MCVGESNNCVGINMGGLPGWTDASAYIFPSEFVHNMFTLSCVGWMRGSVKLGTTETLTRYIGYIR